MLSLFWNLSAALNGYLRFYMPTNRAVDWLHTPRGLKWAVPAALGATPIYLFAMSVCATIVARGGPGYLNVLVMLFAWNALKFAVTGVLAPACWLTMRLSQLADEVSLPKADQPLVTDQTQPVRVARSMIHN